MILLFGGTSETGPVARGLAGAGHKVLVSTATDITLDLQADCDANVFERIERRSGRLGREGIVSLAQELGIKAIVDVAHPYAAELHDNANKAATELGISYFAMIRPAIILPEAKAGPAEHQFAELAESKALSQEISLGMLVWAKDHPQAASLACSYRKPILLTIGSQNLAPYVEAAKIADVTVWARVLSENDIADTCKRAGARLNVVAARGPFSVQDNIDLLKHSGACVLVTKDSGEAGGTAAKLEAAKRLGRTVIIVERPSLGAGGAKGAKGAKPNSVSTVNELLDKVLQALGRFGLKATR